MWINAGGTYTAVFTYKCTCGATETEAVTPYKSESEGVRTYTATSTTYAGVYAQTTKTLQYTVTLNNTPTGVTYYWGDVCALTYDDGKTCQKWIDAVSGAVLADGTATYTFPVTGTTSIRTENTQETVPQVAISATMTSPAAHEAVFQAKWSIPEGSTVSSVKVYRGYTSTNKDITESVLCLKGAVTNVNMKAINCDYKLNLSGLTSTPGSMS
jgi:hypothetical protein